jgi:hypothetical protein
VVTGQELTKLSKEDLIKVCQCDQVVFARTSPAQKLQIVTALQDMTKNGAGLPIKHVVGVAGSHLKLYEESFKGAPANGPPD